MQLSDFQVLSEIGRGSFATVLKAQKISDGQVYALKKINIQNLSLKALKQLTQEIQLTSNLDHPNIVKCYGQFISDNYQYLVLEYAAHGDLLQWLRTFKDKYSSVPETQVWEIMRQLLNALEYIHSQNIIHRDIKPINIFVQQGLIFKIGDLGISKIQQENFNYTNVGTPLYVSPEQVQGKQYNQKIDVWALGCVFYYICELNPPFYGDNLLNLGYNIVNKQAKQISYKYSLKLWYFISRMMNKNAKERPSISELNKQLESSQFERQVTQTQEKIENKILKTENAEKKFNQEKSVNQEDNIQLKKSNYDISNAVQVNDCSKSQNLLEKDKLKKIRQIQKFDAEIRSKELQYQESSPKLEILNPYHNQIIKCPNLRNRSSSNGKHSQLYNQYQIKVNQLKMKYSNNITNLMEKDKSNNKISNHGIPINIINNKLERKICTALPSTKPKESQINLSKDLNINNQNLLKVQRPQSAQIIQLKVMNANCQVNVTDCQIKQQKDKKQIKQTFNYPQPQYERICNIPYEFNDQI